MHFAAFLDLIGKKYTGAGPDASYLAMEKSVAKKIMRFHEIKTPSSAVIYKGQLDHAQDIKFPLIVKPASEDASKGIDVNMGGTGASFALLYLVREGDGMRILHVSGRFWQWGMLRMKIKQILRQRF